MPSLIMGAGFMLDKTITCDIDYNTLNLEAEFGVVTLNIDPGCPAKPVEFKVKSIVDPPDDGCAPVVMEIERTAKDCCGNVVSNPITHTLTIESLPPKFTQAEGSMDLMLACDANIHPKITGEPEFVPGCLDSVANLDAMDTSVFDVSTCQTTVTRKFTVDDNDCMALT